MKETIARFYCVLKNKKIATLEFYVLRTGGRVLFEYKIRAEGQVYICSNPLEEATEVILAGFMAFENITDNGSIRKI